MLRREFLRESLILTSLAAGTPRADALGQATRQAIPHLALSQNRRYLVDAERGRPFFILGDTPWFVQHHKIDDVRLILDDRRAKGFNTLFLELLDDSRIPSRDGYGNVAFEPETEITKPVEAYWNYAVDVLREVTQRGFFVILSELWYGAGNGLWMHHVTPENARVYGDFIGRRFADFKNIMWMHAGDRNPDKRLAECTRVLARRIKAAAPHQLHTVHNSPESASSAFHHEDDWLDVNLGYTYGASHRHILPEYRRRDPIRPVILGETGYEDEPNSIQLLPDAREGDLWTPYRIRRNAWWAVTSGAVGYCAGSRLWRWEKNWKQVLNVRSIREAPHILTLLDSINWWKLAPDDSHEFVTGGQGDPQRGDYVTAARAEDGTCAIVYLPSTRPITIDRGKLVKVLRASWFDPTCARFTPAAGKRLAGTAEQFTSPARNAAGEPDWVLVFKGDRIN